MPNRGHFIVIEGSDGSGKSTHYQLLTEWLTEQGVHTKSFDFPRYGQPSAYFVEKYLNGGYGTVDDVDAYRSSLFYALDRFDTAADIEKALSAGKTIICDRYVISNMGHQGAKISSPEERRRYFAWNEDLEYGILGIPRPDLNIVLQMPAGIARGLVDQRGGRAHLGGKTRDIHEDDLAYLGRVATTYAEICRLLSGTVTAIDCAPEGKIRTIDDIQGEIRRLVKPLIGAAHA